MEDSVPLVIIPQWFGCLLYEYERSRYLPFDHEGTGLLTACLEKSCFEVAAMAPDTERAEGFVEALYAEGLFRLDGTLPARLLRLEPPADHLAGPLAVHLEVATACNLDCRHCFAGGSRVATEPLMAAELDGLFGQLAELGSFRLGITGGEPLLRPELPELLTLAIGHGLQPCVTTNGTLLTPELARDFAGEPRLWLNVSLDGADDATNDAIRGAGSFARTLAGLALLREADCRFALAFTVTGLNHGQVRECARLAHDQGAYAAVFRPCYPVGNAAHDQVLTGSLDQYAEAIESLAMLDGEAELAIVDTIGATGTDDLAGGCGAGRTVCSISIDGEVSPCSFLGSDSGAGNVRRQAFRAIWDEAAALRRMRSPEGTFAGGCRARARAFDGSADGHDPWFTQWQARSGRPVPAMAEVP